MSIKVLRGMNDIVFPEVSLWQEMEEKARKIFERYNYKEIRTPILEDMALFTRSIGDTTNIVEKEMYAFQDRNGKWLALRPEGTASVVRAHIEHHPQTEDQIERYFYMGPMYRHERPQKGRFRQFYQMGVEVLGISSPCLDAEVINMFDLYFRSLELANLELEINSLGCPICRPKFMSALLDHLFKNEDRLCSDCKRRMERNPLRILDCKNETCQAVAEEGPSIQDYLCDECERDFDRVLETLGLLGSTYKVNHKIVRGLDYYIKTTFEFTSTELGSQNAIAGGGRFDGLVRLLGGPNIPGFGCALGMERIVEILKTQRGEKTPTRDGIFFAALGQGALNETLRLVHQLRGEGVAVDLDYEGKSLKSQMRRADKTGARYVVLIGDQELHKKTAKVRDMISGDQQEIPFSQLSAHLQDFKKP